MLDHFCRSATFKIGRAVEASALPSPALIYTSKHLLSRDEITTSKNGPFTVKPAVGISPCNHLISLNAIFFFKSHLKETLMESRGHEVGTKIFYYVIWGDEP